MFLFMSSLCPWLSSQVFSEGFVFPALATQKAEAERENASSSYLLLSSVVSLAASSMRARKTEQVAAAAEATRQRRAGIWNPSGVFDVVQPDSHLRNEISSR